MLNQYLLQKVPTDHRQLILRQRGNLVEHMHLAGWG